MKNSLHFAWKFILAIMFAVVEAVLDFVTFWFNPKPKISASPYKKPVRQPATKEQRGLTVTVTARRQFKKRHMSKRARA